MSVPAELRTVENGWGHIWNVKPMLQGRECALCGAFVSDSAVVVSEAFETALGGTCPAKANPRPYVAEPSPDGLESIEATITFAPHEHSWQHELFTNSYQCGGCNAYLSASQAPYYAASQAELTRRWEQFKSETGLDGTRLVTPNPEAVPHTEWLVETVQISSGSSNVNAAINIQLNGEQVDWLNDNLGIQEEDIGRLMEATGFNVDELANVIREGMVEPRRGKPAAAPKPKQPSAQTDSPGQRKRVIRL